MMRTIEIGPFDNTAAGWESADRRYTTELRSANSDEAIQFCFYVRISDRSEQSTDIMNLRLFFPIRDDLEKRSYDYRLNILLEQESEGQGSDRDVQNMERIAVFLSRIVDRPLYFDRDQQVAWFTTKNYEEVPSLSFVPKDFPPSGEAFSAALSRAREAYRATYLTSSVNAAEAAHIDEVFAHIGIYPIGDAPPIKLLRNIIIHSVDSYEEFSRIQKAVTNALQSYIDQYSYKLRFICGYRKRIIVSEIFPLIRIDSVKSLSLDGFVKVYRAFFSDSKNYVGTTEYRIKQEQKEDLCEKLMRLIGPLIAKENDLVVTIFCFMLRNLVQRKALFSFSIKNQVEINDSVVKKLFADAKTYAEGIYQIIENSCLYSYGKCAYFSMRIHNADRNAAVSDFAQESQTRIRLQKKYEICYKGGASNIFVGDRYSDFLEFYVLDNAKNGLGILPTYNNRLSQGAERAAAIHDLIHETEQQYEQCHKNVAEYYLTHYGLRWFEKIVTKNNGYIIMISPNLKAASVYIGEKPYRYTESGGFLPKTVYYTESNVLLPLSYQWDESNGGQDIVHQPSLFGKKIITEDLRFITVDLDAKLIEAASDKMEAVKLVYQIITKKKSPYAHVAVDSNFRISDVEILAKAIFYHVFLSYRKMPERSLYMVVDFGEQKQFVNEFVRIFSVFYDKAGQNTYMSGVQIALASNNDSEPDIKEINFIIGGKDYDSAYATANVFLYYNSKNTAPFIPLLKFLTGTGSETTNDQNETKTAIDIFPFDLYLKNGAGKSWFTEKMDLLLDRDIRNKPYGCKIQDTHIRISSRIHLNTFFEAELLFHNISIVYRFAYLIARDIVNSIRENYGNRQNDEAEKDKSKNDIMIVGYENYSAVLIQQIAEWVKNTAEDIGKVYLSIITTAETGQSEVVFTNSDKAVKGITCYTIIPVGTTMSTFYKLRTVIKSYFGNKAGFADNFAVVSVCDTLDNKALMKNTLVRRYWDDIDPDAKSILLTPESSTEGGIRVRYILRAVSKWYDLNDCELCRRHLPLIQVDRTATIPNAIFELADSNRRFLPPTDNLGLFKPKFHYVTGELQNTVLYSHLCRGNNHYQFYFQLRQFVQLAEGRIIAWAKKLKIDDDAYNIVLSPLSISNAKFLKIILDNVFSSSLRLIHIDINNTYKEDLRAKFSYISSDYQLIKRLNPGVRINFYYIDDSIVTGQSINRGRMFLKMLIDEAGLKDDSPFYFRKIFLLINRSSYDTVNTFVEDVERDLYSFCNLSIPSYNTNSSFCPGCAIEKKYELLKKRSASSMLRKEFDRLAKKHHPRSADDYEQWLNRQIWTESAYLSMLRSHLYSRITETNKPLNSFERQLSTKLIRFLRTTKEAKPNLISFINEGFLLSFGTDFIKNLIKLQNFVRYLVAQRAYLRLITMNSAYNRLQTIAQDQTVFDADVLNEQLKSAVWDLLNNSPDEETIISYVKVISREHLSTYYHIKRAAMEMLIDLLKAFVTDDLESDHPASMIAHRFDKAFFNPKKYQIVITIIQRLAMLQSSIVVEPEMMQSTVRFLEQEQDDYQNTMKEELPAHPELILLRIPNKEQLAKQLTKSLKIATMLNNDDELCNRLFKLSKALDGGDLS